MILYERGAQMLLTAGQYSIYESFGGQQDQGRNVNFEQPQISQAKKKQAAMRSR